MTTLHLSVLCRKRLTELKNECDRFQVDLQTSNKRVSELTEEVKHWKIEATKSPSFMQRQLTDRLRADLAEKDKQQQVRTNYDAVYVTILISILTVHDFSA